MIQYRITTLLSTIVLLFTLFQECENSHPFDFDAQPKLPYSFNHLDLNLSINPDDNMVRGIATYSISSKIPEQNTLVLHAAGLEIDAVLYNNKEVEYRVSGDSLVIELPDSLSTTQYSELAITWQANTAYGLHKDRFGTFWSSLNPKSTRYWIPIYDHPRVEFSVDADITIPANLEVIFNGIKTEDKVISADQKTISWKVDNPISATGLNFAVGEFSQLEAQSGIQKVSISAQKHLHEAKEIQELLQYAVQTKKNMESALSFEYPWNALHIILIEDGFWDVKNDAAGVVYINVNHGDLRTQIARGIAAQWFGQYQRVESIYSQQQILEVIKKQLIEKSKAKVSSLNNADSLLANRNWNTLVNGIEFKIPYYKTVLQNSIPKMIKEKRGVVSSDYYTNYWYAQTGVPISDVSFSTKSNTENLDVKNESEQLYKLSLTYNDATSKALIRFENNSNSTDDLQSLTMHVFTFDDSTSSEITFTGITDSVSVTVPQSVEYVTFSSATTNIDEVELGKFPVMFLLTQLRTENIENRRIAAYLLRYHTDNPDLQLALKDALDSEADLQTKANLLETLGAFTAGATGTNTQFISQLNNKSEAIQIAAIKALAYYKEDENIPGLLQQKMERTNSNEVFEVAKNAFVELADSARKIMAAQRMINIDTTGSKSVLLLQDIIENDPTINIKEVAENLLSDELSFLIRNQALQILLVNEQSSEYWGEKIIELSNDADPRIRISVLNALKYLPETDVQNIVEALAISEYDPRVLARLREG